jgi:anthranilate phosphoribosyltransferase
MNESFFDELKAGRADAAAVLRFLRARSSDPLRADVVLAFVASIRTVTPPRLLPGSEGAVNIVGTGGGVSTFNVSTAAALVASAAGARVCKSGSRAYRSRCGSQDVLGALGVPQPMDQAGLAQMLREVGIAFVSEAHHSPLLRRMVLMLGPRTFREVGGFVNVTGPLLCPFQVSGQVVGVSRVEQLEVFRDVIERLGGPRTLLVHGEVGLDELSSLSRNRCVLIDGGASRSFTVCPGDLGLTPGGLEDLAGGDSEENAVRLRAVIGGDERGAARDTVLLNAAALLLVAGRAASLMEGLAQAVRAVDEGQARRTLDRAVAWRRETTTSRPIAPSNPSA